MNCREYIDDFLSAHADGELSGAELREAEAHVASCKECATRLAEERAMKSLVRIGAGQVETPSPVRTRLLALLAEEAARGEGAMGSEPGAHRGPSRERGLRALRRPAIWIPTSIAAALLIGLIAVRGFFPRDGVNVVYHQGGSPEFDTAVAYFDKFDQHFDPNVPSDTYGDIAGAYLDAHMPGYIWNFNGSGLTLIGGRLDRLPDKRLATFTFYKSARTSVSLLCVRYQVRGFDPPPGFVHAMGGHLFYSYYGYSICYSYSPIGHFVCVLITRLPVKQLLENVEYASE